MIEGDTVMKGRRPGASQRAERKNRIKMINEGFSSVNIKDLDAYQGLISFSSLTITPIRESSRSTTFIVHTRKPLRWGEFIEKVTKALAESLI